MSRSSANNKMFTKFALLPAELRLEIWRMAMPDYSTIPTFSVIKYASFETDGGSEMKENAGTTSNSESMANNRAVSGANSAITPITRVTWGLKLPPRDRWDCMFTARVQALRSLYDVNIEAREELVRLFPDTIEGEDGDSIPINMNHDLILLEYYPTVAKMLFRYTDPIRYLGDWNLKVHKLAVPHRLLYQFMADLSHQGDITLGSKYRSTKYFVRFLCQLKKLQQLVLVDQSTVTEYEGELQIPPKCIPLPTSYGTIWLRSAVNNLLRVIHGDRNAPENVGAANVMNIGQPELANLKIKFI